MVKDFGTGGKGHAQGGLDGDIDDFLAASLAARVRGQRVLRVSRLRASADRLVYTHVLRGVCRMLSRHR